MTTAANLISYSNVIFDIDVSSSSKRHSRMKVVTVHRSCAAAMLANLSLSPFWCCRPHCKSYKSGRCSDRRRCLKLSSMSCCAICTLTWATDSQIPWLTLATPVVAHSTVILCLQYPAWVEVILEKLDFDRKSAARAH